MTDPAEKQRLYDELREQMEEGIISLARQFAPFDEAEDLYQEILGAIWKSMDSFEGRSSRVTWAYGIATNRACAYRKKIVRRKKLMRNYVQDAQSGYEGGRGEDQILEEFRESLATEDLAIFALIQTDRSYQDISKITHKSEQALRARIKRIKRQYEQRYL